MTEFEKTISQLHCKCYTILKNQRQKLVSIRLKINLDHQQNIRNVGGTEQYSLIKTELHSV